jgi:hypothetical protein
MSGRRRHPRYVIANFEGIVRVSSDVIVHPGDDGDLIVTSCDPRRPGEMLTLELVLEPSVKRVVRVAESRPVMVAGSVRYRLRLTPLSEENMSITSEGVPRE